MPRALITRELRPGSPFRERLEAAGLEVLGYSLIEFTPLPFDELPAADWLFFYSPTAVRFFFEGWPHPLSPALLLAVLGEGTARALRELGVEPDFIGTGEAESSAAAFAGQAAGRRVLFPLARHSRNSVGRLLGEHITAIYLPVYDNQPSAQLPEGGFDVLVFTSPLNVRSWYSRRSIDHRQQVVAIGESTAGALLELGVSNFRLAAAPSEEALAEAVVGD